MNTKSTSIGEDGKVKMQMYMSDFPFEYFLIVKRVEELAKVCELLELEMRESEEEWERGKEQWRREKSYYLNRIEELEYLARMDKTLKSAREKDRPLPN